jgi:hypothetical protein
MQDDYLAYIGRYTQIDTHITNTNINNPTHKCIHKYIHTYIGDGFS